MTATGEQIILGCPWCDHGRRVEDQRKVMCIIENPEIIAGVCLENINTVSGYELCEVVATIKEIQE